MYIFKYNLKSGQRSTLLTISSEEKRHHLSVTKFSALLRKWTSEET